VGPQFSGFEQALKGKEAKQNVESAESEEE